MESLYFIIFWYGILHAFGPDHLTMIADFSIGKSTKKTMLITLLFAFGHGLMLFVFAKILSLYVIDDAWLAYGDMISSAVIIFMGLYLLFMAMTKRIHLNKHMHHGNEHLHIYFGKEHAHHDGAITLSALSIGALMGIGGVRGMLVTLALVKDSVVSVDMVFAFVLGVSVVFVLFGALLLYINNNVLHNVTNVRRAFMLAGSVSLVVGMQMFLA